MQHHCNEATGIGDLSYLIKGKCFIMGELVKMENFICDFLHLLCTQNILENVTLNAEMMS